MNKEKFEELMIKAAKVNSGWDDIQPQALEGFKERLLEKDYDFIEGAMWAFELLTDYKAQILDEFTSDNLEF